MVLAEIALLSGNSSMRDVPIVAHVYFVSVDRTDITFILISFTILSEVLSFGTQLSDPVAPICISQLSVTIINT